MSHILKQNIFHQLNTSQRKNKTCYMYLQHGHKSVEIPSHGIINKITQLTTSVAKNSSTIIQIKETMSHTLCYNTRATQQVLNKTENNEKGNNHHLSTQQHYMLHVSATWA